MSLIELFVLFGLLDVVCFVHAEEFHADVCDGEPLQLECPDNQVLLVKSALYGRMKIGTCIRRDLGYLGCQSSVLRKMDSVCSGYQRCEMPRVNKHTFELDQGCPSDLYSYLALTYECLTAEVLHRACSVSPPSLQLSQPKAVIPKPSIHSLPCFSSDPFNFRMQASAGQQINLTLINLLDSDSQCFGEVIEGRTGQRSDVCTGNERHQLVMLSNSEVILVKLNIEVSANYILQYQVIGCPDVTPPVNGWVKRRGNVLEAGCHGSRETWSLNCVDSRWKGTLHNCSSSVRAETELKEPASRVIELSISPDIVIALIVAVAIIICILTVTVGVVCWKRKHMETLESALSSQKVEYRAVIAHDSPESGYMTNDRPTAAPNTEEALYDFCFTPGQPPVGRVKYQATLDPGQSTYSLYPRENTAPPSSPLYKSLVFDDMLVSSA